MAANELRAFILRAEVVKLYRAFMRTAREAPKDSRAELIGQIRREFELHREAETLHARKYLLSDGRAQLKMLREMLGLVNLTI